MVRKKKRIFLFFRGECDQNRKMGSMLTWHSHRYNWISTTLFHSLWIYFTVTEQWAKKDQNTKDAIQNKGKVLSLVFRLYLIKTLLLKFIKFNVNRVFTSFHKTRKKSCSFCIVALCYIYDGSIHGDVDVALLMHLCQSPSNYFR